MHPLFMTYGVSIHALRKLSLTQLKFRSNGSDETWAFYKISVQAQPFFDLAKLRTSLQKRYQVDLECRAAVEFDPDHSKMAQMIWVFDVALSDFGEDETQNEFPWYEDQGHPVSDSEKIAHNTSENGLS